MKVYFYYGKDAINTYFLVNEKEKEGIIIDPAIINEHIIKKIEEEKIKLKSAFLTNSNINIVNESLEAFLKIYTFKTYSPCSILEKIALDDMKIFNVSNLKESKILKAGSFKINVFFLKPHYNYVCMYKIENALFIGSALLEFFLPQKDLSFTEKIEQKRISNLLQGFDEKTIIFPLSGPPTTVKTIKFYGANNNL